MRISDWSSDVCSSDLTPHGAGDIEERSGRHDDRDAVQLHDLVGVEQGGLVRLPLSHERAIRLVPLPDYLPRLEQVPRDPPPRTGAGARSEEHTSELQSLMRISYAVFCLKKKKKNNQPHKHRINHHTNQKKH